MSNALLSSKTIIREEQPRIRSVTALPTAVLFMLGYSERGPVRTPTLSTSFDEWRRVFGGYTALSRDTVAAVEGFFEEGGQFLWFSRVVHYTDVSNPATKASAAANADIQTSATAPTAGTVLATGSAPFLLAPNDTIVGNVDGVGQQTATFTATAGSRTSGNTEPFALVNNQTLLVAVNGAAAQTITFLTAEFSNIAAATAAEVAAVINAKITGAQATVAAGAVVITSDRKGTSSSVEVTGGTAAAAFAFPGGAGSGTGNVANIEAVTFSEVKTVLEAALTNGSGVTVTDEGGGQPRISSNTTGASSSILVAAASTADTKMGFDNATHTGTTGAAADTLGIAGKYDGAYGNDINVVIKAATSGEVARFDLEVHEDGFLVEVFANLSMDDADANYVETVVNAAATGSNLIAVEDMDVGLGSATLDRPANGTYALNGDQAGNDGLSSVADTDFTGSQAGGTGVYAFDQNNDGTLICSPARATSAVQNALVTYAEVTRSGRLFAVLDPPEGQTTAQAITYFETTSGLLNSSEYLAYYWPRIKVLNPNKTLFGNSDSIVAPVSGHVAGVYARNDAARPGGVYQPPGNTEFGQIRSAVGLETNEVLEENKRDLLYPKRINPINSIGGIIALDGVRTGKAGGNFPTIAERRGVIFIEYSIKAALEFARLQNNTAELRETCARIVRKFLIDQMRVGAFRSTDPDTAFFVDFGEGLNTPAVVFAGQLLGRIGLATQKPAEYIVLSFSQDTRALEQELA